MGLGTFVRSVAYLRGRSLWEDEARLSLNIAASTWRELLAPLDFDQAAPFAFLWVERLAVSWAGVDVYALRFAPFVAGCLVPVVVWVLARQLMAERRAMLVVALVALSPALLRYTDEAKPYAVDAVVAVVLAALAVRVIHEPDDPRGWITLAVVGAVAQMFSFPAILVLAGVGGALLLAPSIRASRRGVVRLVGLGAGWLAIFGGLYLALYRPSAENAFLAEFWEFAFLRPNAPDIDARMWFALDGVMRGMFVGSLDPGRWGPVLMSAVTLQSLVGATLCAIGIGALARRHGAWAGVLLVGPLVAASIASAVGAYPMSLRLLLFGLPALFIVLVEGIGVVAGRFQAGLRGPAWAVLAAGFLVPAAGRAALTMVEPVDLQDAAPLVADLQARHEASEPVYVYAPGIPAWAFYTTDWTRPDTSRLRRLADQAARRGPGYLSVPPRSGRVQGEGAGEDFNYHNGDYLELFGVPTGRLVLWGRAEPRSEPDPGWADNEAARIRRAGDRVWVFFVPMHPGDHEPNLSQLLAALGRAGGTVEYEAHRRQADLYLFRFPDAG